MRFLMKKLSAKGTKARGGRKEGGLDAVFARFIWLCG
jgi:hypothetical protein